VHDGRRGREFFFCSLFGGSVPPARARRNAASASPRRRKRRKRQRALKNHPQKPKTKKKKQNVDCCKHDYKANPKCSWPNTPVSYRLAGACTLNGQAYMVTASSNSQGPPNAADACRCNNPLPSTKPSPPPTTAPVPAYRVVSGYDIPGKDLPSPDGKQPFTRKCVPTSGGYQGKYGYDAYALMCRDTKGCVAAVTERSSSGCAYMKAAGDKSDMTPAADWVVMTSRLPAAKPCTKYLNLGEKCTSDPFADTGECCAGNKVSCSNGVCTSSYPSSG
jgi:hypothetical protein